MNLTFSDNPAALRRRFVERFVLTWEEFQAQQKDWVAEVAKKGHILDREWFRRNYLWCKMDEKYPVVPFWEALDFLRGIPGDVNFMSEDEGCISMPQTFPGSPIGSVALGSARELAELVEKEWFEDYRLFMENRYNPNRMLPDEVYVFDESMTWFVAFTHETTDWESELEDPMKAAESRVCILCRP